jgi:hypothetical protein
MALHATATLKVNALVWIMSPDDADERQSTEQVLTFLEPLLQAKQIPFLRVEPKTAAELFSFFKLLENRAKAGLRPIVHLDTKFEEILAFVRADAGRWNVRRSPREEKSTGQLTAFLPLLVFRVPVECHGFVTDVKVHP